MENSSRALSHATPGGGAPLIAEHFRFRIEGLLRLTEHELQGFGTTRARKHMSARYRRMQFNLTGGLSMANENKTETGRQGVPPPEAEPAPKSKQDDETLREEAKSESTGDAPMDRVDESFIESK